MRGKHRVEKPRDKGQREEPVARKHLESESHRRVSTQSKRVFVSCF